VIKSYKLQRFVVSPIARPRYLTELDRASDIVNSDYEAWEVHDHTLLVWVQSTLSKSIPSRVLGCSHSYEVWERIHEYISLHTKSCSR